VADLSGGNVQLRLARSAANGIYNIVSAADVQGTFDSVTTGNRVGVGTQYSANSVNVATVSPFQVDAVTRIGAADTLRDMDMLERRAAMFQNAEPGAPGPGPVVADRVIGANVSPDGTQSVPDYLSSIGPVSQGSRAEGSALWITPYGSLSRLYANGGVPTIRDEGGGLMLGVDGEVTNHLIAGLMGTYNHNSADTNTPASPTFRSDAFSFGAYGASGVGPVALNASFHIGRGDDATTQTYLLGGANTSTKADFDDLRIAGRFAASTGFAVGGFILTPRAAVTVLDVNVSGYKESGGSSGTDAIWSGSDYTLVRPEFTMTLQRKLDLQQFGGSGWLIGELETGVARDLVVNRANPTVRLPDFSAISVRGFDEDSWVVPVSARLSFSATDRVSIFASYDGQFSTVGNDQSLRGGLQIRF
jgi:uncharacterized protein with beta-barrel porin domain